MSDARQSPESTEISPASLNRLVKKYNQVLSELALLRSKMFPVESLVNVDCGRYVGTGKVVSDCGCPVDKLPVQVGNGNVWWYQIIDCSPYYCQFCGGTGVLDYDITINPKVTKCDKCDGTGITKNVPTKGERLEEQE